MQSPIFDNVPSVSESFQRLLRRVQPLPTEIKAAESHIATIRKRLATTYSAKKFFTAGSFDRDTFIRGKSDVDAYAVISLDEIRWGDGWKKSSTVLDNLKAELDARFPYTKKRKDVHAIVLDFTDCAVDVVPAAWGGFSKQYKRPVYFIPDGDDGWMKTSPELHNDYLAGQNKESTGKLRAVAQLMKFWRECRTPRIPLSSFHIEMALATERICVGIKSYAECVTEVLQILAERDCTAIRDPFGICGNIPALKTAAQRAAGIASVKNSRDHAKAAIVAAYNNKPLEALRQWNIVFRGRFTAA